MNDHNRTLMKVLQGEPLTGAEVKKQAQTFVGGADEWLDKLTRERVTETGEGYYDAYAKVTKSELGAEILKSREQAARTVEGQTPLA